MASPLQYRVHEKDDALYLCLEGDLDDTSYLTVSKALAEWKCDQDVKVDLEGVHYASSTGLRALVLLQQQVHDAGLDFTLLEPSRAIKQVFQTTGLSDVFKIAAEDPNNPC